MVESLRAAPPVPLLASAPQQYLLFGLTNGHSSTTTETALLAAEEPAVPASETIDSLVRPLVESAKPAPPVEVAPVEITPPIGLLSLSAAEPPTVSVPPIGEPTPFLAAPTIEISIPAAVEPSGATAPPANPASLLAPALQITELAIPPASPAKSASPVEPANLPAAEPTAAAPPSLSLRTHTIKFVELPVPPNPPAKTAPPIEAANLPTAQPPSRIKPRLAEAPFSTPALQIVDLQTPALALRSVKTAPRIELPRLTAVRPPGTTATTVRESEPFAAPAPQLPRLLPVAEPFYAAAGLANQARACSEALALQAEALLDEIGARMEADQSNIRAIVATFQARPKLSLLAAPREVVAAPAPPDLQWLKMARPVLPTRKPSDRKSDALIAPPQKLPLAGPCLPPELRNFIEAPPPEYVRAKKGIGLPAWIVSVVIATSMFLGAGAVLQRLSASREAKAAPVAPSAGQAVAVPPALPTFEQHPFARFVEVTGLRVVADLNHRSQVQYIVVNHSSTQLTGMSLKIAVRSSVGPAGSAPLFTVSSIVPSLGPHQSKEIRTDLDSQLRATAIPDWEYLRTDVQVGTQN